MSCFSSPDTQTQTAASVAMGNIAVGNMHRYLPLVLQATTQATASGEHEYLCLSALREIISVFASASKRGDAAASFAQYMSQLVPAVLPFAATSEVADRNVAAECLGLMAFLDADVMLPQLSELFAEGSRDGAVSGAKIRWTVSTACVFFVLLGFRVVVAAVAP